LDDKDLNLGDVFRYSKALGVTMSVMFDDPSLPAADRINHHVIAAHDLLAQLRKLAHQMGGEDSISEKIKPFYGEVLLIFALRFGDSDSKLPGATPIRLDGADAPPKGPAHHKNANSQLSASKRLDKKKP
jgi:hypothetical protein